MDKWGDAKRGITGFVQDPAAVGMEVTIQYFPLSDACDSAPYAAPAVPIAPLPANTQPIINSLNATQATGNATPIELGLLGLRDFGRSYAASNPGKAFVGLLVTDGDPTQCNQTIADLAAIAADSANGTPNIPIYVMGMNGAVFANLNQIAASGGTGTAYNVSTGGSVAFLSALQQIHGQVVGCEYVMPSPPQGIPDLSQIEVLYTNSSGIVGTVKAVASSADCASGGWYYDNPAAPGRIYLCPLTCDTVQKDAAGRISINLGCLGS